MKTMLILPCAGAGLRMKLPYPKEVHAVSEGRLLIDYSLELARRACIDEALLVVTPHKLRPMAQTLGHVRCGVNLQFLVRYASDDKSDAGAVIRGCRRAYFAQKVERFVVMNPDWWWSEKLSLADLMADAIQDPKPLAAFWEGKLGIAIFDMATLSRLRTKLNASLEKGTQGLWQKIVEADMAKNEWNDFRSQQPAIDADEWQDLVRIAAEEVLP